MGYTFIPCYISTISKPFSAIQRAASHPLSTLSNARSFVKISQGGKALRVLDLIIPKPIKPEVSPNHLRLIQACMQDLVEENANPSSNGNPSSSISTPDVFVEMLDREVCSSSLFFQMHKQGMKADASTLSCALSSCGSVFSIKHGVQLHCLAVKTGFDWYVYVGSSLISLYGKCGKLEEAYRVFEEMPVRNVVSWTAIISGYAQHWEVEMCLELYGRMRFTTSKPNDLTFIGILGACTGSGALEKGRNAHCQIIQMGFDSCIHIANALVSMYSKCGNVKDALSIFFNMQKRDLISWNSMITGYAQNGLAKEAINLFKEIGKQGFQPDAVTFLGLLSSCRHAGLVEHGLVFLNSMIKHGVEPELDHYSCIVDLLGRAGMLNEAKEFIEKMPICPNAVIWGSLLSSCRLHGHVWIGIEAAENRLLLDPSCAATHVQLVNLYASAGHWEQTARVRKLMKDRGLKTNPGYSWIEIKNDVYRFRAEDGLNSRVDDILAVVENLVDNMRGLGYVPEMQDKGFDL